VDVCESPQTIVIPATSRLVRDPPHERSLTNVADVELRNAEVATVVVERDHLDARRLVGDSVDTEFAVGGRHVVVGRCQVGVDAPRSTPGQLEPVERLRRRHFVQQMAIDVEQTRSILAFGHEVIAPDLVVQGLSHSCPPSVKGRPW
jgi:hypothetical protein